VNESQLQLPVYFLTMGFFTSCCRYSKSLNLSLKTSQYYKQTVTLLLTTVIAIINNPHVQARAQKELDEVVGTSRLPDFSDRENLPYIDAILSEGLRIHPVLPLCEDFVWCFEHFLICR